VLDEVYSFAEPKWDGAAQLWFDDPESVRRAFESDVYKHESGPDTQKFVGQSAVVWVHEHPILPKRFE
jgi:hypothetical protein